MHPYLLHHGHLYLPTFGALAALGLIAALVLSERTAAFRNLPAEPLWNAGIFAVVSAFAASRLLLAVTHLGTFARFPMLLLAVPSLTPTGLTLTAIAILIYLRVKRLPLLPVLDAWAPCATLLWGFLALGHFAEGSDLGMPAAHLGITPPGISVPLHPIALYAAGCAFGLTLFLYRRLASPARVGRLAALALALTGVAQYLLSFLRQPAEYPLLTLDLIEWIALGMLLAAVVLRLASSALPSGISNAKPDLAVNAPLNTG